jgi:hypothetical protein
MSEILPQFTYSPDGIFTVNAEPNDNPILDGHRGIAVGAFSTLDGIQIEENNRIIQMNLNIQDVLGKNFSNRGDERLNAFLRALDHLLPFHPLGPTDRIASLDYVSGSGSTGVIYPHFQRWMNANGLTEEAGRECVLAMSLPFGKSGTNKARKSFTYYDDISLAEGWAFQVNLNEDKFKLQKDGDRLGHYDQGETVWNWPRLVTLGSCACWGVTGEDRDFYLRKDRARLYEMTPHNVDYARQTLSLLLGLGALAHRAAQYKGQEDIFAGVTWKEE